MDSRELRIGNLVSWYGKPYPIIEIKENNTCIEDLSNDFDQLHWLPVLDPIPLTEEWLVKLGFYKSSPNDDYCINYYFPKIGSEIHIETERLFVMVDKIIIARCQYVHQLQNLYFALTGEELEYDK